ncbi:hypothetical protein OIU34_17255 [Pararhizobium sp. BT-229]|uniref:hypothetical protein n=1 Tax=Pararhizobium sp. BT-229 TaxID=2986923 RepID=UPI0021F76186|nr:hypothetical protein [Pararhizobium sp. BT-229]MCV9963650.1 hypothetical protein [Pararhizobium sp. BT-229]
MKLKIPYVYHAIAVPPGKRKPVSMPFCDDVVIDVRDVTSHDAPFVAVWTEYDKYIDERVRRSLRVYGNALYRQRVAYEADTGDEVGVRPGDLTGNDVTGKSGTRTDAVALHDHIEGRAGVTPAMCRAFQGDDREDTVNGIRDAAADLLVVDGKVWERADAPIVVLDIHALRDGRWNVSADVFTRRDEFQRFMTMSREGPRPPLVVGAESLEMLDLAAEREQERKRSCVPDFEIDEVPSTFCNFEFERDVAYSARAVVEAMSPSLAGRSDRVIMAWVALRRASEAVEVAADDRSLDEGHVQTLFDAWTDLVEKTEEEHPPRFALLNQLWEAKTVDLRLSPRNPSGKLR